MFGLLKRTGGAEGASSPLEVFGKVKCPRALGAEILKESSTRRNCLQSIRDCLSSMTRPQKDDLVDRVLARLALFVFDLPASESNHHSERFGLLDHLLEVAHETAKVLTGPAFRVSPEPSIHHREGPLWAYAGVVAALAHDIGKPLDLDVVAPGTSIPWDPRAEPLRLFCERHDLSQTSQALWHFHKGRGMSGHERHIPTLLPMVLTPEVEEYLGPRLASVLRALSPDENWFTTPDLSPTAQEVIKVVRRMDKATSIEDQESRHPRGEKTALAASRAPAASAPLPLVRSPEAPAPAPAAAQAPASEKGSAVPDVGVLGPLPALGPLPVLRSLPPDFYPMKVPKPGKRRGDPVETARWIHHHLHPARFLDNLRRMLVAKRLGRNGLYSPAYLTPDYVWLLVPEAFEVFARLYTVPFDTQTVPLMTDSLGASPGVVPSSADFVTEFIKPRPDSPSLEAVRIRTRDFLKEGELAALQVHKFEVRVWTELGHWEAPR
jgi:hypothetical protein